MFGRKRRIKDTPPPESENTLYLSRIRTLGDPSVFDSYILSSWDEDENDYSCFMPIACDAAQNVFHQLLAVSCFQYPKLLLKQRLFRKPKELTISKGQPEKIIELLHTELPGSYFFWRKDMCYLFPKDTPQQRQMLFVAKKDLCADFIKRIYVDTAEGSDTYRYLDLWLEGYPIIDWLNDSHLISLTEKNEPIITMHYETTHSAIYIDCHKSEYPEEKLIQTLAQAAEKHGKKLEISI